jgi:hypothetical protein
MLQARGVRHFGSESRLVNLREIDASASGNYAAKQAI